MSDFTSQVQQTAPVQLQLNNSGAWKTLAKFDAFDDELANKARAVGQLLGELGGERTALRIATDEALPCVLCRWTAEHGWMPAQGTM